MNSTSNPSLCHLFLFFFSFFISNRPSLRQSHLSLSLNHLLAKDGTSNDVGDSLATWLLTCFNIGVVLDT